MTNERDWQKAIVLDYKARFAFADWLEEQDDTQQASEQRAIR